MDREVLDFYFETCKLGKIERKENMITLHFEKSDITPCMIFNIVRTENNEEYINKKI